MIWLPELLTLTSILAPFVVQTEATGLTNVVCNDTSLNWSFNSKEQSPCQVAANLSAVCATDGDFTITPLEPVFDNGYLPPDSPTQCTCNTVTYAMISACSLCQGGIVTNWQYWYTNCTNQGTNGSFPFVIPADTYVPKWAFLDILGPNKFDPATAQSIGDSPEATPGTAPFTIPGSGKSSSGGGKNKSNIGPIVGGVVGGIVALLLLAALAWFILRRKKRNGQRPNLTDERTTPMSDDKTYIASPYPHHSEFPTSPTSPVPSSKPYNPNDPSTFPSQPASPGLTSVHTLQMPDPTYGNYAPQAAQQLPQHVYRPQSLNTGSAGYAQPIVHGGGGGYTGVAEI